ncbi:MAG TPA: periplasmic heavy metal sensor [Thermoanaerobaculia bacterium]|nr:periplasmic heavy metal sensor [Thermoanaerobaculia bacterium]
MRKRTIVILAILTTLALAAVPFVYAQGFHRHQADAGSMGDLRGMMFLGRLHRVQAALDLSDAQVDQLKAIAQQVHEQNAPYRQQLRDGRLQIAQALLANPNDTAAAQALIDQQTTAERTMKMNVLAGVSKALNVLTPDQRAKASQFLADRAAREK